MGRVHFPRFPQFPLDRWWERDSAQRHIVLTARLTPPFIPILQATRIDIDISPNLNAPNCLGALMAIPCTCPDNMV